jgi:hypothetical protein
MGKVARSWDVGGKVYTYLVLKTVLYPAELQVLKELKLILESTDTLVEVEYREIIDPW